MRHNIYGKKLSRDKNQRTALFKSLVRSLILSERIQTTQAKAQAIKGLVDKLIKQAKSSNTQRLVSQFITDKTVYNKLINDLVPRMESRNSGYTSVVKLGFRQGDGAAIVQMSLLLEGPVSKNQSEAASELKVRQKIQKSKPETGPQKNTESKKVEGEA